MSQCEKPVTGLAAKQIEIRKMVIIARNRATKLCCSQTFGKVLPVITSLPERLWGADHSPYSPLIPGCGIAKHIPLDWLSSIESSLSSNPTLPSLYFTYLFLLVYPHLWGEYNHPVLDMFLGSVCLYWIQS
jgi:hypothetical protein